jgi:hypothetical protein
MKANLLTILPDPRPMVRGIKVELTVDEADAIITAIYLGFMHRNVVDSEEYMKIGTASDLALQMTRLLEAPCPGREEN